MKKTIFIPYEENKHIKSLYITKVLGFTTDISNEDVVKYSIELFNKKDIYVHVNVEQNDIDKMIALYKDLKVVYEINEKCVAPNH